MIVVDFYRFTNKFVWRGDKANSTQGFNPPVKIFPVDEVNDLQMVGVQAEEPPVVRADPLPKAGLAEKATAIYPR